MSAPRILVSEVGPRDGLQSIGPVMATSAKIAWIAAEAAAGVREIEVGSFVPAKLLPQLADTAEVVRSQTVRLFVVDRFMDESSLAASSTVLHSSSRLR